ncbi:MAG TPA: DUF5985 family protein [Verrucomicrobiae bacterium]|nr:DUF5985 family protein [Verrucomicrobiae bacterium]
MFDLFNQLVVGAIVMGSLAVALYFFQFWRQTRDVLFACFAIAFSLLAIERFASVLVADEVRTYIFVIRLVAFSVMVAGIVLKNRNQRPQP